MARVFNPLLFCGLLAAAQAQTNYQRLKSFGFPELSGSDPRSPLVKGSDGKFYGTTFAGGTNDAGTVFKLNPNGSNSVVLHHFTANRDDGTGPVALVEGSNGALYGTTQYGGTGLCSGGTIFKLNKNGSGYAVLRSFDGCGDAIAHPPVSLIQGSDGALYGTTSTGGVPGGIDSVGAVFRLNNDGSGYLVLHLFTNINDGYDPVALIQGSDGALYGTAHRGGSNGEGTIFKLNRDGNGFAVLRSFTSSDGDGSHPSAGLLEGSDGALYGTTSGGGVDDYNGTVFKLNKNGNGYMILHSFSPTNGDGRTPLTALIEGSSGALYGTTGYGVGHAEGGRLFKLKKDGNGYTVLHNFSAEANSIDGLLLSGLVEGSDGALYGTTRNGGELGFGSVFRLFSSTPVAAITHLELDGAGARLSFSGGAAGQTFRIETKTDLNAPLWQTIATNQFGIDGNFQFLDTGASNYPTRFYRSATP